ncbi:MAG TPA: hypothetical protein VLD37_06825 [Candidatus Bilamarchaeum sp.]|nr:hypothetical protein [Candidatus Bilamarchaeum sp.]
MRPLILLLALSLFLGCISLGGKGNETNETNASLNQSNITNNTTVTPPPQWKHFNGSTFTFQYPSYMGVQQSSSGKSGIFTGTHEEGGQTYEIMVVTNLDTIATYGANKDEIFRVNPTKAASDLLGQDRVSDPAGILDEAYEMGDITTFSIDRGTYGARAPFKIRFGNSSQTFSGHAADIYVPERSLHVKFRVFALDPDKADDIAQQFLLTFRVE